MHFNLQASVRLPMEHNVVYEKIVVLHITCRYNYNYVIVTKYPIFAILTRSIPKLMTTLPTSSVTNQLGLIVAIQLDSLARCWYLVDAFYVGDTVLIEFPRFTIVCSPHWSHEYMPCHSTFYIHSNDNKSYEQVATMIN